MTECSLPKFSYGQAGNPHPAQPFYFSPARVDPVWGESCTEPVFTGPAQFSLWEKIVL